MVGLSEADAAAISSAKVLCVGAGGIGCELFKALAMSGFKDVEVGEREGESRACVYAFFLLFLERCDGRPVCAGDRHGHDRAVQPQPPVSLSEKAHRAAQSRGGGGGKRERSVVAIVVLVCFPRDWLCLLARRSRRGFLAESANSRRTLETSRRLDSAWTFSKSLASSSTASTT